MNKILSGTLLGFLIFTLFAPLVYLLFKVDYDFVYTVAIWLTLTGFFPVLLSCFLQYYILNGDFDGGYLIISFLSCIVNALQVCWGFYAFDMDNNLNMVRVVGSTPYSLLFIFDSFLVFCISIMHFVYAITLQKKSNS